MKAGESERLSLVFIDQLCNEILKTEDNDQELQKFISQLKTKRQSLELDYTGSKFEQVIQYFMTHNINNPGQLAPFFEKIKLLELTLVEAMHLSKNPQNINLNAMQEALKKDPETLMHYGMSNYNRRLCYYIAQDKLIKKNRSDILKEYDKFIKKPADFMTIILHGGNHPDLRDSIDGLAEIYGNATTILFSLSKENRADLLFSFFRTALELQVDLEPILNKFIENNYEIELFNVIEILPPKSLKYLLEKSKKLIDREEFLEYAQSKIDEQEFYRARIENYKNYPSLEHHVMLACLYELHPEYFEYDDMDAIKQIYGENWVNVCEFQKQYEDIIKKIDEKTLKAEDLQDINLSVRLNDGIPLLFKLCESIDCNKLVLDKVETLQELLYLKDIKGRNIVEIAIESGNSELLTSLLGNEKPIIEPLVLTCACKHYLESETPSERNKDNIKALLKSVVDPNYKMSGGVFNEIRWEGVTMLDIFLYRNDLDLVEFALKKYKNIKIYSYNINSLIEYLDSIQNQVAKNNVDDKDEKFNKIIEILQIAIDKENAEITDEHVSNVLRIMSAQNKDQIHEDVKELCRKFLGKMRKEEGKEAGRGNRRLSNIVGSLPCMVGNGDDPPPSPPSPPSYRSLALHPTHEASAAKR
ncbi:MAG: hypothetical protein ISP24_04665 [Rickettsiales bacterium]|nr:hypothetical protein [Rickettsiales bacterium]